MTNTKFILILILAMMAGMPPVQAQTSLVTPTETPAQRDARMAWWHEAKFGMFIHWGVYSEAGGEWKGTTNYAEWLQFEAKIPIAEYTDLARKFDPQKFDAEAWVKAAKDAGMKYLVITAKHHDGFAMYDSPSDPYNIMKVTPFKRDPIKELAGACRQQGIRFCVYYSLGRDWHDPDVPTGTPGSKSWPPGCRSNLTDFPDENKKDFAKYFERKVKPQVRELLTQYGPIGIMWFDTPEKINKAQSVELLAMIRELQPDCIVNVRIGNGLGDYGTPEQEIPSGKSVKPWETCMTINRHWGYNKADLNWKSPDELLRNLIDIVEQRRELPAECRADRRRRDSPAGSGSLGNHWPVAESQRRGDLRCRPDAVWGGGRPLQRHGQGQERETEIHPHLGLARDNQARENLSDDFQVAGRG